MLAVTLGYFIGSVVIFLLLVTITSKERRLGRRLFAVRVREVMDRWLEQLWHRSTETWSRFMRYIIQLNWYYSIHAVLKTILHIIIAMYTRIESMFERNRARAKQLRKEKQQYNALSHLAQVSAHKEETALTATQKQKLRDKQLEGKY